MTVVSNDRRYNYVGNGVATVFTGPKAVMASHLAVYLDGAPVSVGDYDIGGIGGRKQTTVTLHAPAANGVQVLILRTVPYEQDTDISNQGAYLPEIVEQAMDDIVRQTQQLDDRQGLTIRFPDTMIDYNPVITGPYTPGYPLLIDATGGGVQVGDPVAPGDLLLRGDLASPAAGRGASLVSVQDAEDNYVGTNVEAILAELAGRIYLTPEKFGAKGDGVTDDCAAIDAALLALKAAGGGVLRLAPGKTYMLSSVRYGAATALTIPSNVTIIAYGATIKRGSAAVGLMLRNDSDGTVGGYDANSDIAIIGGTWDPNYPGIAGASMPMGFTHTNRIRIRDVHLFSGFGAHHIEINACSNVVIEGCTFEGGAEQADLTMEAVQIDGAINSGTWGTGPYDNTFCTNVKVIGNSFFSCGSGVGTHSSVAGERHNLITIANNTFSSCYFCGVRALNWENSSIVGNHFFGGAEGVRVYAGDATISKGIAVNNNTFWQIGLSGASGAGNGHAINFYGNSSGTEQINFYSICNNVIRDCAFANSGCGIKVLYCPFGTINGNTIDNVLTTGISIFGNGGATISGNRAQNCGASSISAGSAGSVNITDNVVSTIAYTSITRSIITGNIVANASGITASGTNTDTTAIHNLVSTTFA